MRGKRSVLVAAVTVVLATAAGVGLRADVKMEDKSRVQFGGALGKVFNMFGGKTARQGIATTTAVKGDRMLSRSADTGQLIDLAEEKVYTIDFKDKEYTVATFAEIKRRMQEAMERAKKQQAEMDTERQKQKESGEKPPEFEVDVDVKETGETKPINGFDTRQVITTVTLREKGKTLEESGGLVLKMDSWLAPRIPAMKEVMDFYARYWKKLDMVGTAGAPAEQMAAALAMYPGLKDALSKARTEGAKLDGTPIMSVMDVQAVASPQQAAQAEKQEEDSKPTGIGGLGGMFAKKMMKKKKKEDDAEGGDGAAADKNRTNVMRMTSETLSVSTAVEAADVTLPPGLKEKR